MSATSSDVTLLVVSDNARSERRVSPAWTIEELKTRLVAITGIPASSQKLTISISSSQSQSLGHLPETALLNQVALRDYAELRVIDTRPAGLRENFTDVSAVPKYEMPKDEYENRTDSVLAWKKAQKLGRFDPSAPGIEEQKIRAVNREVEERGIKVGSRCRLLPETDSRRGHVKHVGNVPEIPGLGAWIGVALDEPTGKNDGTANGVRYFECPPKHGVFVRPERVEVGDFPPIDDFDDDEF
ncbi:cell polarity protein alp11 [Elsinoe australis]|uniref:Cell polarity protein alp11 n=1 Tax=Elsinoe australis TaxID=40998 RepID=A0A4U7AN22_9PEZI|nr:cell polarity protein alp11 [Elsinoe australis]